MKTTKIREALREAEIYIGDRSAGSAPFWDALHNAKAELEAIAESEDEDRESRRDFFAAAALTGIMAANPDMALGAASPGTIAKVLSEAAYMQADAMLAAREGK
jgi:hypothetical protein